MTEERTLVANLVPEISDDALNSLINQLQSELTFTSTISVESNGDTSSGSGGVDEIVQSTMSDVSDALKESTDVAKETQEGLGDSLDDLRDVTEENAEETKSIGRGVLTGVLDVAKEGFGFTRMIFDYIQAFWKRLEASSPLLQETMRLINNAVNLILMPIGTAIGLELIPLVRELYEFIGELTQTMWEAYEEGGLSAMIAVGLAEGIPALLDFAREAFELIPDDIPVISDIRDFAVFFLDWLETNADALVNTVEGILSITSLVLDNIKLVASVISAFAVAYFLSKAGEVSFLGVEWGGTQTAIGLASLATGLGVYGGMTYMGYADGGYVSRPGISPVAEKEPEYIIPESKVPAFISANSGMLGGGNTFNFYGYNDDEFVSRVEDVVNRNTTLSGLRGGF